MCQDVHKAADNDDIPALLELLAMGEDLSWANPADKNKTALHKAAEKGHSLALEFLLQNNVPLEARDSDGHTALDLATIAKADKVVARLQQKR